MKLKTNFLEIFLSFSTCRAGGAIFGSTDVVVTRSLSREQYLRDPAVPDWANLRCPGCSPGISTP